LGVGSIQAPALDLLVLGIPFEYARFSVSWNHEDRPANQQDERTFPAVIPRFFLDSYSLDVPDAVRADARG